MPVFNRERFVDEAIRSVIAQDFADFELLARAGLREAAGIGA